MNVQDITRVRHALQQALLILDTWEQEAGSLDQRILGLLERSPNGVTGNNIRLILRRRRGDVFATLNLMEQAHLIHRDPITRRWQRSV
jgi:hypothetical protein